MTNLPKVVTKRKKIIGRGYGSGKGGHTVGRGQKGQKARGKVGILFEGVKLKKSLLRRLPLLRGKGRFKSLNKKPIIINLDILNAFSDNSIINLDSLDKANVVSRQEAKIFGVKILGGGKLTKKIKVELPTSLSAARKIKEAGGEVTLK